MNILLLLGIAVFFGTLGGKIFQKLKIPQVVGYIIIGLILGKSFLGIFHDGIIEALNPFTSIALGMVYDMPYGYASGKDQQDQTFDFSRLKIRGV